MTLLQFSKVFDLVNPTLFYIYSGKKLIDKKMSKHIHHSYYKNSEIVNVIHTNLGLAISVKDTLTDKILKVETNEQN